MMKKIIASLLILSILGSQPAAAQFAFSIGFDFVSNDLAACGRWVTVPQYGDCWVPTTVSVGWRPYYNGHWVYSDVGWVWVSDDQCGWLTCHYGEWIVEPDVGWCWIPGSVWAPAWVSWYTGPDYIGWAPICPSGYTLSAQYYTFVPAQSFLNASVAQVAVPAARNVSILPRTQALRNLTVANSGVINRGPAPSFVRNVTHRAVPTVRLVDSARPGVQRLQGNRLSVSRPMIQPAARHNTPLLKAQAQGRVWTGHGSSALRTPKPTALKPMARAPAKVTHHAAPTKVTRHAAAPTKVTHHAAAPAKVTHHAAAPAKVTHHAAAPAKVTHHAAAPAKVTHHAAAPAKVTHHAAAPAKVTHHAAAPAKVTHHAAAPAKVTHHAAAPAKVTHHAAAPAKVTHHAAAPAKVTHHAAAPAKVTHHVAAPAKVTHHAVAPTKVTHHPAPAKVTAPQMTNKPQRVAPVRPERPQTPATRPQTPIARPQTPSRIAVPPPEPRASAPRTMPAAPPVNHAPAAAPRPAAPPAVHTAPMPAPKTAPAAPPKKEKRPDSAP